MLEIVLTREDANTEYALLAEWLVEDRAEVTAGQAVCVVETTKATVEVEAPGAGTIVQLYQTHRPNMPLQNYALAWYQVYLRHQHSAPAQQSVQDMVDSNARLQGIYDRRNAEWHRNFMR